MTATEELHKMLDERGVKWEARTSPTGRIWTYWDAFNGYRVYAMDNGNGTVKIFGEWDLTPEQAIAAALGSGECHMRETTLPFVSDGNNDGYYMICSECGFAIYMRRIWAPLKYCSNCGRKVVDA